MEENLINHNITEKNIIRFYKKFKKGKGKPYLKSEKLPKQKENVYV